MFRSLINNNTKLVKFIIRRERVQLFIWLVSLLFVMLLVSLAFVGMFNSDAERMIMAETMKNPVMIAMIGPIYGADNYTVGAMNANEMLLFIMIVVAIMNIFLVIRNTRRDEERGRIEVIRSLPVGRLTNLSATMTVVVILNATLALTSGIGLFALGIESMDFVGSMLYGVVLGISGLFFAAVTALFVQLSSSSRGAIGYSFTFLGVSYMLRAVGDISNEFLSRLLPMGLLLRTQVYVKNYWWPVVIVLLITAFVMALAFYLNSIRDMDQGFIPIKPGRRTASAFLQSPFGLAMRLTRGTFIGWLIGVYTLGASYGSILGDLEVFLDSNGLFKQILPVSSEYTMTELFVTMLMSVIAISAAIPCLLIMLKINSEEKRNHNEHLLSRAVSRTKLMASYFSLSIVGTFLMLFISVLGLWSASFMSMDDPIPFWNLLKAAIVYIPAIWVMLGIAVLFIGVAPGLAGLSWIYLGFSFFAVYLGGIIQLPDWVGKLTPFGHIPAVPVDDINYATLAILTFIAAVCIVFGFIFYRKRDSMG